ncbi:hypothetical protein [Marinobacter sp.]|jgi:hypothetical protein|uniref:hypothetical protein n=1 Tax=Marinobacter sp. TaxID=50741 RepID=UPI0019A86832|nr:hypothetical protein [Marinobacter sp.]MBC7191419.1 hypothetical protein [Marinobacter sp.]
MTEKHIATIHPLPSSILHNSTEVRRQHTRAAVQQFSGMIRRKLRSLNRKATRVAPDMTQVQGGH